MPVIESSIPAILAERARQQPYDIAYTFIDYEVDQPGRRAPRVIRIDALDFDSPWMLDANIGPHPKSAYLQYTSGSTRHSAGVLVSHRKKRGGSEEEVLHRFRTMKREVTSAILKPHSVQATDLVPVPPGSIPITTSGRIRRSACAERCRLEEFSRLDVTA